MPLSPSERTIRARLAAYAKSALYDGRAATETARASGPGNIDYWLGRLPDEAKDLPRSERLRRAEALKKAHYLRLALLSAKSRKRSDDDLGRQR